MNGTSRIGSSPIANAARHGSTAATTAATMIPMGTIAVVTNPTTCVRSRVGVNSSASGTAITATPGHSRADEQAQQGDVPPASVGSQGERAGREREQQDARHQRPPPPEPVAQPAPR